MLIFPCHITPYGLFAVKFPIPQLYTIRGRRLAEVSFLLNDTVVLIDKPCIIDNTLPATICGPIGNAFGKIVLPMVVVSDRCLTGFAYRHCHERRIARDREHH